MQLAVNPTDEEILAFVEQWIDCLSSGDFDCAYRMTAQDPYYAWTPELISLTIAGYGLREPRSDGRVFAVTDRASAVGRGPRRTVDRDSVPPGSFAFVEYDLPLNGEWSDLTATFRLERRENHSEAILEEIHVF